VSHNTTAVAGILIGAGLATFAACALAPDHDVQVRIGLPQRGEGSSALNALTSFGTLPSKPILSVDDFECFAVNAYGNGIGYNYTSSQSPGLDCPYRGVTSTLASANDGTISLKVPSGAGRTIQMIGVATYGKACPTNQTLEQFEQGYWDPNPNPSPSGPPLYQMVEIGKTKVDLFRDQKVEIQNSFVPATAANGGGFYNYPFGCPYAMASPFPTTSPGPNVGPKLLPIVSGFVGFSTTTGYIDTPGGALPPTPAGGSLSFMTPAQVNPLSNPANSTPVWFSTTATTALARTDFIFDTAGEDLTKYSAVRVVVAAAGGASSACDGALPLIGGYATTPPGYTFSLYNSSTATWLPIYVASSGNFVSGVLSTTVANGPLNQYLVAEGAGSYFHVSIRSTAKSAISAGPCSGLLIQNVQVWLDP
jgi:hypothetical protein